MASVNWLGLAYVNEAPPVGLTDLVYRWDLAGNWSTGSVPQLGDDITIVAFVGQPVLQSSTSINSLTVNAYATLAIGAFDTVDGPAYLPGTLAVTGNVTDNGGIVIDSPLQNASGGTLLMAGGGSRLTAGGALTVNGSLTIGRSAFAVGASSPIVSVGSLTYASTGSISLDGDAAQNIASVLDVGAAPAGGVLTGKVSLADDSLLDYTAGGLITSIVFGGNLVINGPKAFLASGASTTSNSALVNLASIQGAVTLVGGASLTTNSGDNVTVGGTLNLDTSGAGGGALTIQGALTLDSAVFVVGSPWIASASTVTVNALDFAGTTYLSVNGGASAQTTTLSVGSTAGFGQNGVLSGGDVRLAGNALLDFTGGGLITSIAFGANLTISGQNAYLASGASTSSNSALSQLTTVGGNLTLDSAAVTTTAPLTIGDGSDGANVEVDFGALTTQQALILNGSQANLFISASLVTAASLSNLAGEISVQGTLDVLGDAANSGAIGVFAGLLQVGGALSGSGTLALWNGVTAALNGGYSNAIAFHGVATLALAQQGGGVISSFGVGDRIDLTQVAYAATDHVTFTPNGGAGGTVSIADASETTLASFNVGSTYAPSQFALRNDGLNHLEIDFAQVARDYAGSGTSDILWKNQADGRVFEWTMSSGRHVDDVYLGNVSGLSDAGAGDFTGNGTSDLLWQSQSTGDVYEWQMSGGQHTGTVYLGNLLGWSEAGVGDFQNNGTDDLLWQSQSSGDVYEWTMSNGQHTGDVYLGNLSGWSEIGVGNFYGGGAAPDLLWQSQSTGDVYEWQMSGGQHTGNDVYLGNLSGWSEVGVGDFTGSGTSDLLWQNQSTGDVYEWTMSNGQRTGSIYLGNLSGWSVVGTGDYTGNGVSDIIWQNQSSGAAYEWTMTNGQHTGDIYLGQLAGWQGK
jgi:hypothetical protein